MFILSQKDFTLSGRSSLKVFDTINELKESCRMVIFAQKRAVS